jgi:hypothetical protein
LDKSSLTGGRSARRYRHISAYACFSCVRAERNAGGDQALEEAPAFAQYAQSKGENYDAGVDFSPEPRGLIRFFSF